MSEGYTLISNEIWEDKNLRHTEFRVLTYLIRLYSLENGYSFPTREQISENCCMNKDTVGTVLKSLETKGYIRKANNSKKSGRNNIYFINKYLVVIKHNKENSLESISNDLNTQSTNYPKEENKPITDENDKAMTDNEKTLLDARLIHKLNNEQLEQLNKLDNLRLIKAIKQANKFSKTNTYSFNYLMTVYNNQNTYEEPHKANNGKTVKGAYQQKFTNNKTIKTTFHGVCEPISNRYTEDELETKLLKAQALRRA